MNIIYNDIKKDLPVNQLCKLFVLVGWANGEHEETEERLKGFMKPWLNSTLVVSAWDGDKLVGAVRVLSDTIFRSIIYDLLVSPEYQGHGIGKELVNRCKSHYPGSEWLVGCDRKNIGFYKKLGFEDIVESDVFLVIPCKLF
jgi:ribosomal protein S18 acetylase RimI-like enzyme